MKIPVYQVDAFAGSVFRGNPAVVCLLEKWLPDSVMQRIAMENSVPETAFIQPFKDGFKIRWFTPDIEMDLCGHATLASAHVIVRHLNPERSSVKFYSQSGNLNVQVQDDLLTLDFPSRKPVPSTCPQVILSAFECEPVEVLKSRDFVLVFESEQIIQKMKPDENILNKINLDPGGICVTAPGRDVDFVSRFFTPGAHIFEDPVTGSAHCSLIPYWSERLGKVSLRAKQLSARGGDLVCRDMGERVLISGRAVTYLEGTIIINLH